MTVFRPIKTIDIELSRPIETVTGLRHYSALKALLRLHGRPLGFVQLGVTNGYCSSADIKKEIMANHSWSVLQQKLFDALETGEIAGGLKAGALFKVEPRFYDGPMPSVSVVICTRNRTNELRDCLAAVSKTNYQAVEILVVDNAPNDDATENLVRNEFPGIRYVRENVPGLSRARNRAIREATGEIIAFTDDDVVADPEWVPALARLFGANPMLMAATGLVVASELETEPQILFEMHGGFGRGFERRWHHFPHEWDREHGNHHGSGKYGSGANMAFRKSVFQKIGDFDTVLGAGTPCGGGEDIEMFFRVLNAGLPLVYEPNALVYHRHRRDYATLKKQMYSNGTGLAAYHYRSAVNFPEARAKFIKLHFWWLLRWHLGRLVQSLTRPHHFPRELILTELRGYLIGPVKYLIAKKQLKKQNEVGASNGKSNGKFRPNV